MCHRTLSALFTAVVFAGAASWSLAQQLAPALAPPTIYPTTQFADVAAPKVNVARGGPGGRRGATQPATAPTVTVIPGTIQAGFLQAHESFVERAKQGNVDLLFLGDSITQGWGGQARGRGSGQQVWTQYYGNLNAANFGIGGDQTQHVLWRIENGELENIKPKVAVIMIGTNNTAAHPPEQIAHGVELIVKTVRTKLPNTKVLLLAIFPRGRTVDDPLMASINKINPMIAKLDDGKMIRFLDINAKFFPQGAAGPTTVPSQIMPDALHPNAAGYQIWAEAMQPLLTEMMK